MWLYTILAPHRGYLAPEFYELHSPQLFIHESVRGSHKKIKTMKKTLRTICIATLILQNSICFGQLVLPSSLDSSLLEDSKYFELKIELIGKCTLDKEITFKYHLKNISDKNRKLHIYNHFGSPINMGIILKNNSGIPLEYQSNHVFSNFVIKPSIDSCKNLKPDEVFTGEVSLNSALSRNHGLERFFLTSGEYILKVIFFNIISNNITFQLANMPELDTIQNVINKYVPNDWEVNLCPIISYPKVNILDENGKFVTTIYIHKKNASSDAIHFITMKCYKSLKPEFGKLVVDNRIEPNDCVKKTPDNYNYKIATINGEYIFIEYGSHCWGGYSEEQRKILQNIIDGINKTTRP